MTQNQDSAQKLDEDRIKRFQRETRTKKQLITRIIRQNGELNSQYPSKEELEVYLAAIYPHPVPAEGTPASDQKAYYEAKRDAFNERHGQLKQTYGYNEQQSHHQSWRERAQEFRERVCSLM